jgi:hypothetical protein
VNVRILVAIFRVLNNEWLSHCPTPTIEHSIFCITVYFHLLPSTLVIHKGDLGLAELFKKKLSSLSFIPIPPKKPRRFVTFFELFELSFSQLLVTANSRQQLVHVRR